MPQPTDLGYLVIILIVATIVRYVLIRRTRKKSLERYSKALQEHEKFLTSVFASFSDFSLFDFSLGHFNFSYVSPFPEPVKDEWRYRIVLSRSESEDISTINHEITECTLGRLIENLLDLEKPLYFQRKELDKFWVHGKKQKYLVEHILATLGEADDLTAEKLTTRLNKEDIKGWLNP